jgi:sulfotransferase
MVDKVFFNSSLPRSGSTLLQNILAQNDDFYVTPTSGVLELVFGARANYTSSPEFKAQNDDDMKIAFKAFCRDGVFGFFNALTDKPYVMDKSRGWGYYRDFLDFFYPNPKIVCIIRDPRSIFGSMEKNYRKNPDKAMLMTSDAEMKNITTEQRIDTWVNSQPVGLAFQRLYQIIKEERDKDMLFVKYEELCKNPSKEMVKVYNYLGLEQYEHDFANVKQVTQEDDSVYGIFGDHKIKDSVSYTDPDYKQILGVNTCNWIKNNYSWFYSYFKYL